MAEYFINSEILPNSFILIRISTAGIIKHIIPIIIILLIQRLLTETPSLKIIFAAKDIIKAYNPKAHKYLIVNISGLIKLAITKTVALIPKPRKNDFKNRSNLLLYIISHPQLLFYVGHILTGNRNFFIVRQFCSQTAVLFRFNAFDFFKINNNRL